MPLCEHFIYTSAEIESKKGYQIISMSLGIKEEITSELNDYFYPTGVSPNEFRESRSLLLLRNNWIAYSKIKNIGVGYDGRPNTLYNHTILIKTDDFRELNYDSRIFEDYYLEIPLCKERLLEPIRLESRKIPPSYLPELGLAPEPLEMILKGLIRRRRIAILKTAGIDYIQNILSVLPPSLRLIPFSTLVIYPDKQPKFNFIEIPKQNRILLRDDFLIIDPHTTHYQTEDESSELAKAARHITDIIISRNPSLLEDVYEHFEKTPGQDFQDKLLLSVYFQQFRSSPDISVKEKYAMNILKIAEKLDEQTVLKYFEVIKESLKDLDVEKYYLGFKINRIISESMNQPLILNNIEKMLVKLEPYTSETRLQLLGELINRRKDEFVKNGKNLLMEACFSSFWHADEIIRIFLDSEILRTCINEILGNESRIPKTKKHNILAKLIEKAVEYKPYLIPELLEFPIFNLFAKEDLAVFTKIVINLYSTWKFYNETDPIIILKTTSLIRSKIQEELLRIVSSNRKKQNNKNLKAIIDIVKILLNTIQIISNKDNAHELANEITEEEKRLKEILEKYAPQSTANFGTSNLPVFNPFVWPFFFQSREDPD